MFTIKNDKFIDINYDYYNLPIINWKQKTNSQYKL